MNSDKTVVQSHMISSHTTYNYNIGSVWN